MNSISAFKTFNRYRVAGLLLSALFLSNAAAFDKGEGRDPLPIAPKSVWDQRNSRAFAFDNDLLVPGGRDQDYTFGLNLTITGAGADEHRASAHRPLQWLDDRIGLQDLSEFGIEATRIEYGLFGFTPEDIDREHPRDGDRPYASLVYVASTSEHYDPRAEVSWQTTLTLGVMGLDLVGDIQDAVHALYGGTEPLGWETQISAGGEPTARYSVSRQQLLYRSGSKLELKSTLAGSVGYITEASYSLSLRAGRIQTPWISFNPELATYGEKAIAGDTLRVSEHYFWTGIALKLRAYNAFLQGQFRDSELSYDSDELNHGIVEAWLGYSLALDNGYSFTYSIRGHTSELKRGVGDRSVVWGGILITRELG